MSADMKLNMTAYRPKPSIGNTWKYSSCNLQSWNSLQEIPSQRLKRVGIWDFHRLSTGFPRHFLRASATGHHPSAEGDTRISHSCWLLLASESFGSVALQKFRLPRWIQWLLDVLDHWTPELIPKKIGVTMYHVSPESVKHLRVIICHIWSSKNLFQGLCHSLGSNLPNLAMTHYKASRH